MNKMPLTNLVRILLVMRGLLLVMLLICMFPWPDTGWNTLIYIAAGLFLVVSFFEFSIVRKMQCGRTEIPDERDTLLMQKAADKAITINKLVLLILVMVFCLTCGLTGTSANKGYLFAFVGMCLPSFIKYCIYLHYERTDEGEYFE